MEKEEDPLNQLFKEYVQVHGDKWTKRRPTHRNWFRTQIQLRMCVIILRTVLPELLRLAGNGLPINGMHKIRRALKLPPDGGESADDKAE